MSLPPKIFTTPARSLEQLLRELSGFEQPSPDPIHRVLSRFFEVSDDHADYYAILGAIHGRFDEVVRLVDHELAEDPQERDINVAAINALRTAFTADPFKQNWNDARPRLLHGENLARLAGIHHALKHRHSFEVLSDQQVKELVDQIEKLISELDSGITGIPPVLSGPIRSALLGLKRVLSKFRFYGYGALQQEWNSAFGAFTLTQSVSAQMGGSPSTWAWMKATGKLLLVLYGAVHAAKDVAETYAWLEHVKPEVLRILDYQPPNRHLPAPGNEPLVPPKQIAFTRSEDHAEDD